MATLTSIVVPCYNEERRLASDRFREFVQTNPSTAFVFVNDGSTDRTLDLIQRLESENPRQFSVINQQPNQGKAEAVRVGMLAAFVNTSEYAGYWDADLATPLDEIPRFVQLLEERPEVEMVFGSRVKLLGRSIERNPFRHYLGRIFATAASVALALPIYDTQCGAKLFRRSPQVEALFAEPFKTGWIFDVEIVARLIRARRGTTLPAVERVIYELPLNYWRDVAGSQVKPRDFFKALIEIINVYWHYLRR
jgi:dolichyl-phosphate beta-glucosyltransferase